MPDPTHPASIWTSLRGASTFNGWLTPTHAFGLFKAACILVVAATIAPTISRRLVQLIASRLSRQQHSITRRAVSYAIYGIGMLTALGQIGIDVTYLVGSAGIVAVGLAYASQKSVSQLISGVFIIAEQPFVIGDTITVAGTTGEVLSIDLLSTKLRTGDNLYVRIPNEMMLGGAVTNTSHYPIRRLDMDINVSYREDISRVSQVLFNVADKNPLGLEEPKPLFIFGGYGDSALKIQFCVWGRRENLLDLKNSMYEGIKKAFDAHGIEMPYPHTALVPGAGLEALKISMLPGDDKNTSQG